MIHKCCLGVSANSKSSNLMFCISMELKKKNQCCNVKEMIQHFQMMILELQCKKHLRQTVANLKANAGPNTHAISLPRGGLTDTFLNSWENTGKGFPFLLAFVTTDFDKNSDTWKSWKWIYRNVAHPGNKRNKIY